ncbi:MAG: hypothetical protein ABJF11_07985 [Reichenbachiella sp.]|uniref:hypothetical protein n=1 Tax=Reichenbachiella sp. TaxID=2184521 RepID=UPI003263E5E4
MKRVIVIFSLVFVSMFGFSACEGESEFDEIQMDLPTSTNDIDDDDETGDPTGG